MASNDKKARLWAEAKAKCRLSNEAIRMAKEMGLNPLSLIKNIPSPSQRWKAPVEDWVRDIYESRQRKSSGKRQSRRYSREREAEWPNGKSGIESSS